MTNAFFERPILNSPYEYPGCHWELDAEGQPTQQIVDTRRPASFITPIPKPKKRKGRAQQAELVLDEGRGLSTEEQQYHATIINQVRRHVDRWRELPESRWNVTPETARLLNYWRHHPFEGVRPFFCQIEAVETARQEDLLEYILTTLDEEAREEFLAAGRIDLAPPEVD